MHKISTLLLALLLPVAAHAQRGVPIEGFPTWHERMLLVLANRARVEPTAERYNACGISTPTDPLIWDYDLNRAARFHASNLSRTSTFSHDSPCTLVQDISDLFAPYGDCDGSASCACEAGTATCRPTCTDFAERLSLFGVSGGGRSENIAQGQSSPREVHDGWMNSAGHCQNLLGSFTSFGGGWMGSYWVQNFSTDGSPEGTLLAGGHEPRFPASSPTNIEFRVSYHDERGAPINGVVNIDGYCTPMSLERGTQSSGTYLATVSLTDEECHRYFFFFEDPDGGYVYLPEAGSYGVGSFDCVDWSEDSPLPCGELDVDPPVIVSEAQADSNPVTSTTAVLTVEADHESGEESLTYTWSTEGPADVTFSLNGSNEAKITNATFAAAGDYTISVEVRDRQGQTTISALDVAVIPQVAITVLPTHANVAVGSSRQFTASAGDDQFGNPPPEPVTFEWSVDGGGTIDEDGLFVAEDLPGGPHTVRAGGAGAEGTATVTVVEGDVDTTPPEVWLLKPVDGQIVSGVVHFLAEASDDVGVAKVGFLVNGQLMRNVREEPYEMDWTTAGRSEGEIEIVARATDHAGNDTTSPPVRVYVVDADSDEVPPTVAIVSPVDGEIIVGDTLRIEAEAEDDVGVESVAFEVDGERVGSAMAQPWEIEIDLSDITATTLTIEALATDLGGNESRSEPVTVEVVGADGGGCACAAGTSEGSAPLLLVLVVALSFVRSGGPRSRSKLS